MNTINQKKVYIDVDEEITTVIDHLYRTKNTNIVFVVPKHALLLQSVVNLKILLQEAKKQGKNISLMTRDEDGVAFAMRAGINVQQFVANDDVAALQNEQIYNTEIEEKKQNNIIMQDKSHDDVHMVSGLTSRNVQMNTSKNQQTSIESKKTQMDMMSTVSEQNTVNIQKQDAKVNNTTHTKSQPINNNQQGLVENLEVESFGNYEQVLNQARIENNQVLQQHKQNNQKSTKKHKGQKTNDMMMSKSTNKTVKGFLLGGLMLIFVILSIVILPKTKINIEPKDISIDETMEMTAKADQDVYDAERRLIPARVIEKEVTFTKTFNATGTGDVKAQKAQGTITIFNEYNEKSQPLVATTRFLSENGMLFRLVNQTVVPGMVDGEPGKVDALVIADETGAGSNIGPSRFSIPGFEGSPKKDKFYAVSEKSMIGGGTGGNNVTVVTIGDIENAKKEMEDELSTYIKEQITGLLRPDNEVLVDENITYEVLRSEANMSENTMTEQFMYEIVTRVKAIVFSENDVSAVMEEGLSSKYPQYDKNQVEVKFEYKNVKPNFENGDIKMKVQGLANVVATVDVDAFKQDILGKKHDEILSIMEERYNNEIEKITIESVTPGFPAFVANRISRFALMTNISVQ